MKNIFFAILLISSVISNAQTKKWTLKECVDYAIKNNISIQQSELNIQNSELSLKDAKGDFLPNLNGSVSHRWNTGLNNNPTTGLNEVTTNQNSFFGINSNITLFNGLRNIRRVHQANLQILANKYQLDDMKDNVSLLVANSYLQILFNKENLKSVRNQYLLTKSEYERTEKLVEAEVLPKGDLLEIESSLATQEQQIITATNAIVTAKISLANLLLLQDFENFEIAETDYAVGSSDVMNYNFDVVYQKAIENRNDIKAAETAIKIQEKGLEIAKGDYYPTLTGSYNFNTNYFNPKLAINVPSFSDQIKNNKAHSFGLSLNIPIFNRFQIKNSVSRAKINIERSKLDLENTRFELRDRVGQAYNDAKGSLAIYNAAMKTVNARKLAYEYSQKRFEVGLMNSFDYNQSRTRFETAQNDLIRAKFDYIFKQKVLEFYFGLPLEK